MHARVCVHVVVILVVSVVTIVEETTKDAEKQTIIITIKAT